ncbi:MAG: peptidoglycan-binding domain-containing protein [Acidobacteriota bacterium]
MRRVTTHHRRRHYRRRHHYYHRHHYRHVRASRERISQIQKALVKAGYLHAKPDGIWGSATRDAMRKYQKANGFTPTGLPEAKPLMKLGLGPHPLPPALDRAAAANAKTQEGGGTSVASDSSPSSKSSSTSTQ